KSDGVWHEAATECLVTRLGATRKAMHSRRALANVAAVRCSPRTRSDMSTSLFSLENEIAVVIGATGVLGGALAEGLAAAGAKVAVLGRNAERGEARAEAIRKAGGDAQFFAADAMERESVRAAHEQINAT